MSAQIGKLFAVLAVVFLVIYLLTGRPPRVIGPQDSRQPVDVEDA